MDRREFLIGAAKGAAAVSVLPSLTRSALAQPSTPFSSKYIGYDIEGTPFVATREYAVQHATQFDFLVALQTTYPQHVGAMFEANPDLGLAVYVNLMHTKLEGPKHPDDWYLYDRDGNVATGNGTWVNNLLMNPLNAEFVDWRIRNCLNLLRVSGYPALYIDGGGLGPLSAPKAPIDPRTGRKWVRSDWLDAMEPIWTALRDATGVPQWANNLGDPTTFYDQGASRMVSYFERLFTENYLRGASEPLSEVPGAREWHRSAEMTKDCGGKFSALTKLWPTAPRQSKDRWHGYALASYLATSRPGAAFYCTYHRAGALPTPLHPYWKHARALGSVIGAATDNKLYRRPFRHGQVIVNPTSVKVTRSLRHRCIDQNGNVHSPRKGLHVAPHTGLVLLNT